MITYYVTFAVAILIAYLYPKIKLRGSFSIQDRKEKCIWLAFVPIAFVLLFRWKVGIDANWERGLYPLYYHRLANGDKYFFYEPVFEIIARVCAKIGISYWGWLVVLGLIYLYAICKFIKEKSSSYSMSIFFFLFSDLFFFAMGALRQALAISFILLLYCCEENKWRKYVLMSLAVFSHSSGILGVICYFAGKIKLSKKSVLITVIAIILSSPLATRGLRFLIHHTSYGLKYDGSGLAMNQFAFSYVIMAGCTLLCVIFEYDYIYNERTSKLIILQILFFFLMINSSALIQTFRIIYYFMPASLVLIPEIYKNAHSRLSKVLLSSVATFAILLVFYNTYYLNNGKEMFENYQTIFSSIEMITKQ